MLNNLPLHALIVHMPIALTVLVPLFALLGLWLGRRVMKPHVAWAFPVGMLALLLASGVAADKTGEQQEDKVERVVPEAALERHEEAGDGRRAGAGGRGAHEQQPGQDAARGGHRRYAGRARGGMERGPQRRPAGVCAQRRCGVWQWRGQ
jgi:hypothetical protein